MCDEIGEQGTYHTHIYIAFKNSVMFSSLQKRFYGVHIDVAHGTSKENRDYIRKEGKWLDDEKHDTNLTDTFEEFGIIPDERQPRIKASEDILNMIEAGANNAEILHKYPSSMTRIQHIEAARQTLLAEEYRKTFRILDVNYISGKTGIGKTRTIMEKHGYENVYRVTNYSHPFDSYKSEPVILFDEFRSSLPITEMLNYLDGYPIALPCRYNDKVACYTTVYIVSNIPFSAQYPNVQLAESETWNAFQRRFNNIIDMRTNDFPF